MDVLTRRRSHQQKFSVCSEARESQNIRSTQQARSINAKELRGRNEIEILTVSFIFIIVFAVSGVSLAAGGKTYQVTGPVLEVSDSMIAVQKGKERWEIARSSDTKVKGDVKVGDKVTVMYTMTATTIENKGTAQPSKTH